jgi:hypothetical protein
MHFTTIAIKYMVLQTRTTGISATEFKILYIILLHLVQEGAVLFVK